MLVLKSCPGDLPSEMDSAIVVDFEILLNTGPRPTSTGRPQEALPLAALRQPEDAVEGGSHFPGHPQAPPSARDAQGRFRGEVEKR